MKSEKGQTSVLSALGVAVVGLLFLGVVLGVTQLVLQDMADEECTGAYNASDGTCLTSGSPTYKFNATNSGQQGLQTVAQDQGLLGTVIVAGAVLTLVALGFRAFL